MARHKRQEALIELAKEFLRGYFADGGTYRPSDLEDDILGGGDPALLFLGTSRWFRSPFSEALGAMVKEGEVEATQDERGWAYRKALS